MERKYKLLIAACISIFMAAFPLSTAAAEEYQKYNLGTEFPPDLTLGQRSKNPDVGKLEEEYDEDGNLIGIYLTSLMETKYTEKDGNDYWLSRSNSYNNISAMNIVKRTPGWINDPAANFRTDYQPANPAEPFKGGVWRGTGIVPLTATINRRGIVDPTTDAANDFMTGNYGAYVRVEFPIGVDARSMALAINWVNSGASSKFDVNAFGISVGALPFVEAHFPLTWAPEYTRWSKEDPNAFYILIRGLDINYFKTTEAYTSMNSNDKAAFDLQVTGLNLAVALGHNQLGNIQGHAASYAEINMDRYKGNLTTQEIKDLNIERQDDPTLFIGADDSPEKVLTRGTFPPEPSNKLNWTFYYLDRDVMLSPETTLGRSKYQMQDAYFLRSMMDKNPVPNNQLTTWSTYFSPIDRNHEVSSEVSLQGWNIDPLKSFNTKSQLDSTGKYLTTEFQENLGETYTQVLPGSDFKERDLTLVHKDLLMTYGELNDSTHSLKGGQDNRFVRVIDFFKKSDITHDENRQLTIEQTTKDDDGNEVPLDELMNHLNEDWPVYFNGTATASTEAGGGVGTINSATLNVLQKFEPPLIKLADDNSTNLKLREVGQLTGTVHSVESATLDLYYSLDNGAYQKFATIENPILGEEIPFAYPDLVFDSVDEIGEHTISIKAIDEFQLESEVVSQIISVAPNEYKIRMNYLDNNLSPIHKAQEITIKDTNLTANSYSISLKDYALNNASWLFEYVTVNDDLEQFSLQETVVFSLNKLIAGQTDINYHYLAITPEFEIPKGIGFGIQKTKFQEQVYFPEAVDGKLSVRNNTNMTDWALKVQGTDLEDAQQGKTLKGALNYYKEGQANGISAASFTVFNGAADGDASAGITISDSWTLADKLSTTPTNQRNGFTINTFGASQHGNYTATLNWTFVTEVN
ncbi:hypothetical protein [Enterococcus sp. LJL90]